MTHDEESAVKPTIIDLDPDQVIDGDDAAGKIPQATAPAKRSPGRFVLWASLGLLIAAVAGGWLYRDVLAPYLPSDALTSATTRLAVLEGENKALHDEVGRISKLADTLGEGFNRLESKVTVASTAAEQADAAVQGGKTRLAELDQSMAGIKATLLELKGRIGTAPAGSSNPVDNAALAQLSLRLDALEKDVASLTAEKPAASEDVTVFSQSLSDLKAKIASGVGFAPELERIQRLVPAAPGLDELALHAAQGIPDAKGLADELTSLAETLPKPEQPVDDDGGSMFANAWKAVSGLVRVRNLGDVDWPAAARSAATISERGELRNAIDQLNAVEGSKPAGLSRWLERAEARLRVEAAAVDVGEAVMRAIAAKG